VTNGGEPADQPAVESERGPAAAAAPPKPQNRGWRRVAPLFLVAAVAAIGWILLPKLPHEREIELKVKDPASVVSVEMSWASKGDAVHGGSWRFDAGKAPPALFSKLSLSDGRYEVDIEVRRAEGPLESWHRSIDLEKVEHMTLRVP
jgi:hypothetical protein